jgi:tripartite-type tricarboxylate transporter receptor subunit TctC
MRRIRCTALLLLSAFGIAPAAAQNYPTRAIHIIVPFPAGGPSDVLARLIGDKMSVDFQQPVVVENRPGANTVIGAEAAAKATADGYTLLMAIDSTLVMKHRKSWGLRLTSSYFPLAPCSEIAIL